MAATWKAVIWDQFGAGIDMLGNALQACPEELWQERLYDERSAPPAFAEFWYVGYHALFWLDLYLSESSEGFAPPARFTLSELEAGLLPERVYTKPELQAYLEYGRDKCRARLEILTDAMLAMPNPIRLDWPDMTAAELLLHNMRHVHEHASQLSLFLGQRVGAAPRWLGKARGKGIGG